MHPVIVGLGNPGPEYELTRHNVGFLVLDQLADAFDTEFEVGRYGEVAACKFKGKGLHLLKPSTYMNLSGKAVNYWMQQLKIPKDNLLIVTDDVSLPFGLLRMRPKGSDAGHNGLKSIEQLTGGNDYPRLRFGIGDNFTRGGQVDYVLSRFTDTEFVALPAHLKRAGDAVLAFTSIGMERAMNEYNQKPS